MKNRKLEIFKNRLFMRVNESMIDIQSRNYPGFIEGVLIAGIYAQAAAIFRAAVHASKNKN